MPSKVSQRIRRKLLELAKDPYAKNLQIKKLQERSGYRLRVGDWRVIYEVDNRQVRIIVLKVAPRGGVYR